MLFDLGVSSLQLDRPDRGFSYSADAPLDMRMDPSGPRTAADVVNTYSPKDLARVLRVYGEERFASRIAAAIDRERAREPFTSTARLAELVRDAIPAATRRTGGHPAKRTFQALRIEVNDELGVLERALPAAVEALAVGGRIVVITFHSLEDRIVKQTLAAGATDRTPPGHAGADARARAGTAVADPRRRGAADAEVAANPPRRLRPGPRRRAHPESSMSGRSAARGAPVARPCRGHVRAGDAVRAPRAAPRAALPGRRPCARSSAWSRRPPPRVRRRALAGPGRGRRSSCWSSRCSWAPTLGLLILNTVDRRRLAQGHLAPRGERGAGAGGAAAGAAGGHRRHPRGDRPRRRGRRPRAVRDGGYLVLDPDGGAVLRGTARAGPEPGERRRERRPGRGLSRAEHGPRTRGRPAHDRAAGRPGTAVREPGRPGRPSPRAARPAAGAAGRASRWTSGGCATGGASSS